MQVKLKKCAKCRQAAVSQVSKRYETTREHDGRTYSLAIPDLSLLVCGNCGNQIVPDDSDDRLNDALRDAAGLLKPREIREFRTRLQLTQELMADDIGIAKETLSRWETGAQIQQRAFDNFLRAYFHMPSLRAFLRRGDCSAHVDAGRLDSSFAHSNG